MEIQARMYQEDADIGRMQALSAHVIQAYGKVGHLHMGYIPHRIFNVMRPRNPRQFVRLWFDKADELAAWAIIYAPYDSFNWMVNPVYYDTPLEDDVLRWSEIATHQQSSTLKRIIKQGVPVHGRDQRTHDLLHKRGYTRADHHELYYTACSLAKPLPPPQLPDGFHIRPTTGLDDIDKLIEVHHKSFGSEWTPAQYRRILTAPGHDPERELVVVAPDGTFAAFCIYWLDETNALGLFEPVGTHIDYRRRGLAKALLLDGLHRMDAAGMREVLVSYEVNNRAAAALYESVGFHIQDSIKHYALPPLT